MKRFIRANAIGRVAVLVGFFVLANSAIAFASVSSATINPTAQLSPGHQFVMVSGSLTCTAGDNVQLSINVIQEGKSGSSGETVTCTGNPQQYSVDVAQNPNGLWHSGRASASVNVFDFADNTFVTTDAFIRIV